MLVIRRRPGESVLIGDNVEIEIIDATPSRVRLGIKAPSDVPILRKETKLAGELNQEAARRVTAAAIQELVVRLRS
jgi:carbon storage regulator